MLAAALVPFWEGARVTSRYALVAAVGLFPLMGSALERLKPLWLRAGLALVLVFEFLPVCLPNRRQHVTLEVNSMRVAEYFWQNCDSWQAQLDLPAAAVHVGWNSLTIQADFADQPIDPASGRTTDTRRLSVAVTRLLVGQP